MGIEQSSFGATFAPISRLNKPPVEVKNLKDKEGGGEDGENSGPS